jgi:hypothetical protein
MGIISILLVSVLNHFPSEVFAWSFKYGTYADFSPHAPPLSPTAVGCGPPVAPSGGSELDGTRRRRPEVDLARDVEAVMISVPDRL